MHREYIDKISCIKECIQKKNKQTILLKQTEQDLIQEKLKLNRLLNEYEKKSQDVFNLETTNITSLFYAFLGSKEEQLKKERQETLRAKLKYDQCKHDVEYLVEESKNLVDELSKIDCCEREYEELINNKLDDVLNRDKDITEKLKRIIKRKENIRGSIKEVDEAILVGELALKAVENVIESLERTEVWGLEKLESQDVSFEKIHDYVDDARAYAEDAQRLFGKFKREISDINMITNCSICMSAFDSFSDSFFDGLISDWIVQSEIVKTLDIAKNVKNQVDRAMSKLYEEKVTEEFMLQQMEVQIKTVIEKV